MGTYRWLVEYYRSYCDHKWGLIDGWLNIIEVIMITRGFKDGWLNTIEVIVITSGDL